MSTIQEKTVAFFQPKAKGVYTKGYKDNIRRANNFKKPPWSTVHLLWGDHVYVIAIQNKTATVSARGHIFDMPVEDLTDQPVLHLYQIDCGVGDAALLNFPDGRWMCIDGGPGREWSNTGKIAVDFLYWKIFVDFSWRTEFQHVTKPFHIDSLVCTHSDFDHFGGLMDLAKKIKPASSGGITIGTVFHGGLCRMKRDDGKFEYQGGQGFSQLGPIEGTQLPDVYLTTLMDDFNDFNDLLASAPARPYKATGEYKNWLKGLAKFAGNGVGGLQSVHYGQGYLTGYAPAANNDLSIKILGPVREQFNGKEVLRYLDTSVSKTRVAEPSLTRNGHSVVLRIDYKNVKILMSGDLNFNAQALLLDRVPLGEFKCHVAKGCHHGSEDISWAFLKAMSPVVTIISSGDQDGSYSHPRSKVLAWTGAYSSQLPINDTVSFLGHTEAKYDTPMIYSTELARSVVLRDIVSIKDKNDAAVDGAIIEAGPLPRAKTKESRPYREWMLADNLVYGLVNVRTDGKTVVTAVLREGVNEGFQVDAFEV
jgi:hypothetical protein